MRKRASRLVVGDEFTIRGRNVKIVRIHPLGNGWREVWMRDVDAMDPSPLLTTNMKEDYVIDVKVDEP